MHPINKNFFGPEEGKISIKFHDGTSVVTGHIVKQTGLRRFLVSDGTTTKEVMLAPTTTLATNLVDGLATIEVTTDAGTEYVLDIHHARLTTTSGKAVSWKANAATTGNGVLKKIVPMITNPSIAMILGADCTITPVTDDFYQIDVLTVDSWATSASALMGDFTIIADALSATPDFSFMLGSTAATSNTFDAPPADGLTLFDTQVFGMISGDPYSFEGERAWAVRVGNTVSLKTGTNGETDLFSYTMTGPVYLNFYCLTAGQSAKLKIIDNS